MMPATGLLRKHTQCRVLNGRRENTKVVTSCRARACYFGTAPHMMMQHPQPAFFSSSGSGALGAGFCTGGGC
jgi:hypothetical protein